MQKETDWKPYELTMAIHLIEREIRRLRECSFHGILSNAASLDIQSLVHAIDFINHNMKEKKLS